MADLETFRAEARAWIEDNCPASMRVPGASIDELEWGGRRRAGDTDEKKKLRFENERDYEQ